MLVRLLVLVFCAPSVAAAQVIEHVSRNAEGQPGNGDFTPSVAVSADGRIAAFVSTSSNLVPGGTNGRYHVFVRAERGAMTLVTRGLGGALADADSDYVSLSPDGRIVAFRSQAGNLVPGDTNGRFDVFAYDRELGTLERVSVTSQGGQSAGSSSAVGAPHLSRDGRYVVFDSGAEDLVPDDTNGVADVFLRDRQLGLTTRLSTAADGSQLPLQSVEPRLTPSGGFLVFTTSSPLAADDLNGANDVYLRDLAHNTFERASVSSQGVEGNGFSFSGFPSADGRFVVFLSTATNLVAGDTNAQRDVFVRDRLRRTTQRVSVSGQGAEANGLSSNARITDDGRCVYFTSWASNLEPGDGNLTQDLFVRDRRQGTTRRVGRSTANAWSEEGLALSGDGSALVFLSRPARDALSQVYLRIQPPPGPMSIR